MNLKKLFFLQVILPVALVPGRFYFLKPSEVMMIEKVYTDFPDKQLLLFGIALVIGAVSFAGWFFCVNKKSHQKNESE